MDKRFLRKNSVLFLLIAIFITVIIIASSAIHHEHQQQKTIALYLPEVTTLARNNSTHATDSKPRPLNWQKITLRRGDTLKSVFAKAHINKADRWAIVKLNTHQLSRLKPKEHIFFLKNKKNELIAMRYPLSPQTTLLIHRKKEKLVSHIVHLPITTNLAFNTGRISTTLSAATHKAGLNHKMYSQLKQIFQGTVSFTHDLRRGDQFSVLYKEYYINGKRYRTGKIVAAELINRGKKYQAIHYSYPKGHSGYYTPKGHGIEPLFLSAPVHYRRISSRFSYNRFDPILHKVHPHLGIDYAANTGTPIRSIGDGRIVFIGYDGGYGNAIKIQYGRHYEGLYAHMWKFADNLHIHQTVHKGQVIGYVGSTGWSTGHHLHFGFYVDGVARNWLAFKQPTPRPIPKLYRPLFKMKAKRLLAALSLYQATELAANNTKSMDTSG